MTQKLLERILYDRDPRSEVAMTLKEAGDTIKIRNIQGYTPAHEERDLPRRQILLYVIGEATILLVKNAHREQPYKEGYTSNYIINPTEASVRSRNQQDLDAAVKVLKENGFREYQSNEQAQQLLFAGATL